LIICHLIGKTYEGSALAADALLATAVAAEDTDDGDGRAVESQETIDINAEYGTEEAAEVVKIGFVFLPTVNALINDHYEQKDPRNVPRMSSCSIARCHCCSWNRHGQRAQERLQRAKRGPQLARGEQMHGRTFCLS